MIDSLVLGIFYSLEKGEATISKLQEQLKKEKGQFVLTSAKFGLVFGMYRYVVFILLTDQNKDLNKSLTQANRKITKLQQQLEKSEVNF